MAYKIRITLHAEELLDDIVSYILFQFKDDKAAGRLLEGIDRIYDRMSDNPFQFPLCDDRYLSGLGIRKARIHAMDYYVVFSIEDDWITVLGFFHALENYSEKVMLLMLP